MDFGRGDIVLLIAVLLICLLLPNSQEWLARFRLGLDTPGYEARGRGAGGRWWEFGWNWPAALASGLILGVALRFAGGYSEFIYFQF
jgi:hypothetical protein